MRFARGLALLLVVLIAALAPVAYAVVTSALLHEGAPGDAVAILPCAESQAVPAPVADSTSPRAPPLTVAASSLRTTGS